MQHCQVLVHRLVTLVEVVPDRCLRVVHLSQRYLVGRTDRGQQPVGEVVHLCFGEESHGATVAVLG